MVCIERQDAPDKDKPPPRTEKGLKGLTYSTRCPRSKGKI